MTGPPAEAPRDLDRSSRPISTAVPLENEVVPEPAGRGLSGPCRQVKICSPFVPPRRSGPRRQDRRRRRRRGDRTSGSVRPGRTRGDGHSPPSISPFTPGHHVDHGAIPAGSNGCRPPQRRHPTGQGRARPSRPRGRARADRPPRCAVVDRRPCAEGAPAGTHERITGATRFVRPARVSLTAAGGELIGEPRDQGPDEGLPSRAEGSYDGSRAGVGPVPAGVFRPLESRRQSVNDRHLGRLNVRRSVRDGG